MVTPQAGPLDGRALFIGPSHDLSDICPIAGNKKMIVKASWELLSTAEKTVTEQFQSKSASTLSGPLKSPKILWAATLQTQG